MTADLSRFTVYPLRIMFYRPGMAVNRYNARCAGCWRSSMDMRGCACDTYKLYRQIHRCCPRCGVPPTWMTTMGVIAADWSTMSDPNRTGCDECGWKGTVHDLVPE